MLGSKAVSRSRNRGLVVIFWILFLGKHSTDGTVSAFMGLMHQCSADEQDESDCYLQSPLMPHKCGTSRPCQSAQTASSLTQCGWIFRDGLLIPKLSQFTSSFRLNAAPVINTTKAWCIPVKNHSLTVDLGSVTNVTKLAVQGDENTTNYVTAYEVDHSQDGVTFINVKNGLKPQCSAKEFFGAFPGTSTGSDIAENNITIPFRAQYVRFRPQESVGDLCTRVDIYGCQSDEGYRKWSKWSACALVPTCSRSRTRTCERKNVGCMGLRNQTQKCARNLCERVCGELGIIEENRSVDDSAFTASSFIRGFEPFKARLNGADAWCADTVDQNQFLEIDLGGETEITEIKTQGLEAVNRSAWVSQFFLDIRSNGDVGWKDYLENNVVRVYPGNNNGSGIMSYTLVDPPTARFIRFYPLMWNEDICMRVSVSGCRVTAVSDPVTGKTEEEVDEAFWIILWVLLALLLLLLLLGLLYLCCRYCPCCAFCGCCPCAKKRRTRLTDGAMMTELTSDEIDAGRTQYSPGFAQADSGGTRLPETETQTLAVRIGEENDRASGTGAVSFTRTEGEIASGVSGAKYNEGYKVGETYQQTTSSSGVGTSHRDKMQVTGAVSGLSQTDGARGTGTRISGDRMMTSQQGERMTSSSGVAMSHRDKMQVTGAASGLSQTDGARGTGARISGDRMLTSQQGERMTSSQYQREATTRSYQDSLRATSSGAQYIGRYDVEAVYPGEGSWKRNPLGPPPTIELDVYPQHEDGSWRVERMEKVDDRLRARAVTVGAEGGGRDRESELVFNGVGYCTVEDGGRELGYTGVRYESDRHRECKGVGYDEGDTTITVHLGEPLPVKLEARGLETEDVSRAARERYFNDDTYRAGRGEVETWKVDCIRGQSYESSARGGVSGETCNYNYEPISPTTSTASSQFNGSTISEQFGGTNSKKGQFYKMFEYSRD